MMQPSIWVILMAAASSLMIIVTQVNKRQQNLERQRYLNNPERSQELLRMVANTPIPELLDSGEKMKAIKEYRERYHASLHDAKEAIDALQGLPTLNPKRLQGLQAQVQDTPIPDLLKLGEHKKLEAIKVYRQQFHASLGEAKTAIDRLYRAQS